MSHAGWSSATVQATLHLKNKVDEKMVENVDGEDEYVVFGTPALLLVGVSQPL